jgi:hypothetical protein
MHRHVVVPRLTGHHVRHPHLAALELSGGCVDEPVPLGSAVDRLGLEQHDAYLAGFEMAPLLQRCDELFAV